MRWDEVVRGGVAITALAASVLSVTEAQAQPWTGERWVRGRPHRVEGEGALFVRNDQWVFSPSIAARFRVIDEHDFAREAFIMDVDLAARGVGIAGPADSFRVGNPYLGVRFGYRHPLFVAHGGVGSTVPLTNAFDDGADDWQAYRLGQAVHGAWDAWLMEPEIQPLIVRGDLEMHGDYGYFGFDAAFAVIFPIRDSSPNGGTEWAFQTGAYGAWTPVPEVALGARVQTFFATDWRVGFGGVDEAQFALIPFFRLDFEPVFFEFRLVMNLDDPFGFAFDDSADPAGAVWATTLTVGARF